MEYRKLLEKYYEYLGIERPTHKLITNHLLCFADWLSEHASQQGVEGGRAESCGCLSCGCPSEGMHYEWCIEIGSPAA